MDPQMWANLITGGGGAIVVLAIIGYSFAKGYIVRGSELTKAQDDYAELSKKYMQVLEERASTAETLAETLRKEARESRSGHD